MAHEESRVSHLFSFLFFPICIIYLDIIVRIFCFEALLDIGILYMILFSIPIGLVSCILCSLSSHDKVNRIISIIITIVLFMVHYGQVLYFKIFGTFMMIYSVNMANDAAGYWKEALGGVLDSLLSFILMLLPLLALIFFGSFFHFHKQSLKILLIQLSIAIVMQVGATVLVHINNSGIITVKSLYTDAFNLDTGARKFGLLTSMRLDLRNLIFGSIESEPALPPASCENDADTPPDDAPDVAQYENQVMNIDFDALIGSSPSNEISDMHTYFKNIEPTKKNDYTGLWEGKNLIWICAEGFSSFALNEELTPTLYKLSKEGIVCTDFYNPIWGASTSDGEYVPLIGLIPKSGIRSFARTAGNWLPFTMGNQLSAKGYKTLAYHNHYYTYYDRHKSHPNMGYVYKGLGNGLNVKETWPESDLEMVQLTLPEFQNDSPFHVYYMTVSGHMYYTFDGNSMSFKNQDAVASLPYSERPKAYIACNIELDKALTLLLETLESKGVLDNTAIVLSGDHYPYGLELDDLSELAGHDVDPQFEKFKSTLILWSGDMADGASVYVDKPVSTLDMLPTVSNLMGLEFDSRLVMGHDIFSDADPLVIFYDRSWITEKGRFISGSNILMLNDGVKMDDPDAYARNIVNTVNQKFDYSARILENDYYRICLPPNI